MPLRMRAPYLPRVLRAPARVPAGARVAAGRGRGAIGPSGIDTSSTGNVGGDIVKAIGNMIQQNRMNAVANQILNTQNPPRAGLVAPGVNPVTGQANVIAAGTPTIGTPPQTGGVGELQMRQAMGQQDLADQLQRAKIASEIALARSRSIGSRGVATGGGSGSRWRQQISQPAQVGGRKPGKPAAYVAGTGDVQNDSATDNFNQIRTDFDAQHGKGSFDMFTRNLGNAQDDGKGNLVLQDQNGKTLFSIPKADVPFWTQRYNAARVASGQDPLGDQGPGSNPNSGQQAGTQINPYAPKTNLEVRSLPYGSYMIDPSSGQLTIKQRPVQGTQAAAQPAQAAAQPAQESAEQPTQESAEQPTEDQAAQDQAEAPDDTTASAGQVAAQPDQLAQADQDQEEARRRQAMLSLAMNQAGAGSLYPAQDVMS